MSVANPPPPHDAVRPMSKQDADRLYQLVATLDAAQTGLLWRWITLDWLRKASLEAGLTP